MPQPVSLSHMARARGHFGFIRPVLGTQGTVVLFVLSRCSGLSDMKGGIQFLQMTVIWRAEVNSRLVFTCEVAVGRLENFLLDCRPADLKTKTPVGSPSKDSGNNKIANQTAAPIRPCQGFDGSGL
ncbi:hypothetical protein DPEC_G00257420 [Dallia pectoralis]|uniref:Uncharacterized protein n=1 Tax=Dallia pectoralis TaxID=75939 RepID=A0ACC2FQQ3_DALPE|nr:hypothetical protein DPEC_G00257420 [Dallia pectoralis]